MKPILPSGNGYGDGGYSYCDIYIPPIENIF